MKSPVYKNVNNNTLLFKNKWILKITVEILIRTLILELLQAFSQYYVIAVKSFLKNSIQYYRHHVDSSKSQLGSRARRVIDPDLSTIKFVGLSTRCAA